MFGGRAMNAVVGQAELDPAAGNLKSGPDAMGDARPVDAPTLSLAGTVAPVVVAGGGPAGTRAAQGLSAKGHSVVLINAERWRPYNRVKLTPLLAGEAQLGQIYASDHFPRPGKVQRYDGVSVIDIDRDAKTVLLSSGRAQPYSKLILALGSRAFVPAIPGKDLPGVYTFRNFDDTEALLARSMSARNVVVIGGGLLGLEAARGMARRGAAVTVVEHETRLMPRQLDLQAGEVLKERIKDLGIEVITGERVDALLGDTRIESVLLNNRVKLPADTVIVCTGVRANTQLPSAVGLAHNRGVLVDDAMRTSDPDIYAIGECAEHEGRVYGLVGPGYEQAAAAVADITGDEAQAYAGSTPTTKLKVLGADVFSAGDFESIEQQLDVRSYTFQDKQAKAYRRIFVDRGRLVAAIGVGSWPEASKLQQAVGRRQPVRLWNTARFSSKGSLWAETDDGVTSWPGDAIVCNCTGVTKGTIVNSVTLGAGTLEEVRVATSANTVCGTCKPLIQELLGEGDVQPEPVRWWKWLVGLSLVSAIAAMATAFLPRIPLADSYVSNDFWYNLWFGNLWKQYSGYTLLGLSAAAAILGLRKRLSILKRLGSYETWRFIHLGIGILAALGLVAHTGFRLGSNLNLLLMISFLVTLGFGAIAGLATGGDHELQQRGLSGKDARPRSVSLWVHILALWPLPVLLMIHVVTVYAY